MEARAPGLPVLRSSEHGIPRDLEFEVFHETNAPLCDTDVLSGAPRFWLDAVDYLVDDVVVGRLDTGPHSMRRSARHLRSGSTDWIMIQVHHSGGLHGTAGRDTTVDLGPTEIGVIDLSEPLATWSCGGATTGVLLPRHRVVEADRLPAVSALDKTSPRGRVLDSAIADLWRRLAEARGDEASELAGGIAESVNSVLAGEEFAPTDRDLSLAMRDFLKVNLGDLDLDVEAVQRTFHCSRATVYRAFKPCGGVAEYIREQRLLRCFDELSRPTEVRRRVSEVATRWGFENPSHFNRIFKGQFGLPPSALNASSRDGDAPAAHRSATEPRIGQFRSWTTAAR